MAGSNLASGFNRIVAYGKESTFGTKPARNSGKVLRRTAVDIQPNKDPITSNEIRSDYQRVEFRHGIRRVTGSINSELGVGTHADFIQSLLRRDFAANAATTSAAVGDGFVFAVGTITRSGAGSFITDGFKEGDVVRVTGAGLTGGVAGYTTKNFRLKTVTATVLTSDDFDGILAGPVTANVTISVPGKETYIPVTGHTSDCYTVEVYERGMDKSLAYKGVRIGSGAFEISPNAMTTVNYGVIGRDFEVIEESGGSSTDVPYFTSPTAAGTGALLAGPNGVLRLGSTDLAIVTGASINIDNNLSADPVIGAVVVPDIFYSAMTVNGQFTLFVPDYQMLKDFDAESELQFHMMMETPVASGVPGFFSIYIPRLKLSGFNIPENQGAIIQTVQFEALKLPTPTSTQYDTTILVQDSSI